MAYYLWRVAEIHVYKIVIVTVGCYCLYRISLLNLILFIILLFNLLIDGLTDSPKRIRATFSGLFLVWVCLMTILTMVYQLQFIDNPLITNCTYLNNSHLDPFLEKNQDNLDYIGITKSDNIFENIKFYMLIFVILSIQKIIKVKSKYNRLKLGTTAPVYTILFEEITWKELDQSIIKFFKYQVNFFFYKFGLEICFCMTSIVIITRMDAYALLYGIPLGIFLRLKRKTIRNLWMSYFVFLLFLLLIQYIECVGLPPVLCYGKYHYI